MKRWVILLIVVLLLPFLFVGTVIVSGGFMVPPDASAAAPQCITTPGQLPAAVPQPLNSIISAAAAEYGTDPLAIAAVYANENGSLNRVPAPPEGDGSPWPVSSSGAVGPMQFLPSTFYAYRNANPARQPGSINSLVDSVFAAAQYLSDLGAAAGVPLGDPSNPRTKPTLINALASYHSGPGFTSLGPAGRAYVAKGYATITALTGAGPAAAVPNACFLPAGTATEGYPNSDSLSCAAGTDMGVQKTAKGNNIRICNVRGFTVNASISTQVDSLVAASSAAGFTLRGSGFRSLQSQIDLRRANCGSSSYDIWERPSGECSPETARPGESQHEQGLALDFAGITSRSNLTFRTLVLTAGNYGFRNLPSEPWHWSTSGR